MKADVDEGENVLGERSIRIEQGDDSIEFSLADCGCSDEQHLQIVAEHFEDAEDEEDYGEVFLHQLEPEVARRLRDFLNQHFPRPGIFARLWAWARG